MGRNTFGKNSLLISIIEAVVVSLAFISMCVYLNYDAYSRNFSYQCKEKATFGFDVFDSDGNRYPAGYVFEVDSIYSSGRLALEIQAEDLTRAGREQDEIAEFYGLSRIIKPAVDLSIEDAENSAELAQVFEKLKNDAKNDFWFSCLKSVAISLLVCAVSCALFLSINVALKNKPKARYAVLVGLSIICVAFSIGAIMYLGRAL